MSCAPLTDGACEAGKMACPSHFQPVVGVTGRYSNRQITQLATQLLDWALDLGP